MHILLKSLLLTVVITPVAAAEETSTPLGKLIERQVIDPELPLKEVQVFTEQRVPRVKPIAADTQRSRQERQAEWSQYTKQLRQKTLDQVVFRGQAAAWRKLPTRVEWLERIDHEDYVIRKLRYEVIPGMWAPGLLYEPKQIESKTPVVLNVNGHDRAHGKAAVYKQTRCINQAKRGMIALNLEWLGMGQLNTAGFNHYRMNQLDLCGTSGIAPFYLAMSRGLDILLDHPQADPERVAVAGLSGGGWQTIFISGLDPRVTLANPVAGYSSFRTRARFLSDLGDSEQTPSDLATVVDYTHLTAMRAPNPTLLTNNAEDNCCFRAEHALPPLIEAAAPVYRLFGRPDALTSHVNHDPGNHNFEQDNRQQLYAVIGRHFFPDQKGYSAVEINCDSEIHSDDELRVDLPADNADFHNVAQTLVAGLKANRKPSRSAEQLAQTLTDTIKVHSWHTHAILENVATADETTALYWWLRIGGHWTVPCVELRTNREEPTETVLMIADGGRQTLQKEVQTQLDQGRRVLLVDLFYFGESHISQRDFLFALLVAAVGERPLGVQVSQLNSIAEWAHTTYGSPVRVESHGPRTSTIALAAGVLKPETISALDLHDALTSLAEVIDYDWTVQQKPELFCFGLLKQLDLPQLEQALKPDSVSVHSRYTPDDSE